MTSDAIITDSVIKFLLGEAVDICRLCLTTIKESSKISIDDNIDIETPYLNSTLTYAEILKEHDLYAEPPLPRLLCISCATVVANSYLFKKLSKYSEEKWDETMTNLNHYLDLSRTLKDSTKSVFVLVNDTKSIVPCRNSFPTKKKALVKFKEIVRYRQRYVKIEKDTNFVCEKCGENFESRAWLAKHRLKAHREKRYPCSKCQAVLPTPSLLEIHVARNHLPKRFKCRVCENKKYSSEKLLKFHEYNYHVAVICKICFIQFPSRLALRSHMDTHCASSCENCGKAFKKFKTYHAHVKTCGKWDEKMPKYFCDICGKGYVQKPGLRSHLLIEHGFGVSEDLYSCKWCGKKYDAKSKLRNHIITHTKERNFTCDVCGNKFVTQHALLYHTRLHTGEKPYKCDMCNESFLSASRRMDHKHRKHLGPTKECPVCHVNFTSGFGLKKHVKRHYDPHSKLYVPNLTVSVEEEEDEPSNQSNSYIVI